ncbi:MAG: phenylphosphate carboxylase subunit delta, partial [Alcaligenaceae bacterium]
HGAARECCDLILAAQHRLGAFFQPGLLGSGPVQ